MPNLIGSILLSGKDGDFLREKYPTLEALRSEIKSAEQLLASHQMEQPLGSPAWEQEIEERAGIKLYLAQLTDLEKEMQAG